MKNSGDTPLPQQTPGRKKGQKSITMPSGRPIPKANPTKPFYKGGWSIF